VNKALKTLGGLLYVLVIVVLINAYYLVDSPWHYVGLTAFFMLGWVLGVCFFPETKE